MIPPSDHGPLFLLAVSLDGDLSQTAAIAGADPAELSDLATALDWRDRFRLLAEIKETEGPDAFAREVNRLTNLQQSVRCRDLLSRAADYLMQQPIEDLLCSTTEKGSKVWSARVLTDITKSIETVQTLTYRALGDSITERATGGYKLGAARLAVASRGLSQIASALDGPTSTRPTPAKLAKTAVAPRLASPTALQKEEAALRHALDNKKGA